MPSKYSLYRQQKRARGLCTHCTSPAAPDRSYCIPCRDKVIAHRAKRATAVKVQTGKRPRALLNHRNKITVMEHYGPGCRGCGETEIAFLTLDHIADNGSAERKSGLRGGADLYSRLINSGFPDGYQCLCWNCNHLKEYVRSRREPTTAKAKYRRVYKDKLVSEVFGAYGSMCVCCGLDDTRLLTVDHIDGGGKQHLKSLNANTDKFYCWLRSNGFPDNFRLLCRNCNSGRSITGGVCPHKIAHSKVTPCSQGGCHETADSA